MNGRSDRSEADRPSRLHLFSIYGRLDRSDFIMYYEAFSAIDVVNVCFYSFFIAASDFRTREHALVGECSAKTTFDRKLMHATQRYRKI